MTHLGTIELTTPRLLLRRFTLDDAQPMFKTWANDPAVTRFLRWEPHPDWTATAELLYEWGKNYARPDWYRHHPRRAGRRLAAPGPPCPALGAGLCVRARVLGAGIRHRSPVCRAGFLV